MRLLLSFFPLACYTAGAGLFVRFGLDRAAHARVQRELDARPIGDRQGIRSMP
jgi:Na+/melibiose symporter-like transporter